MWQKGEGDKPQWPVRGHHLKGVFVRQTVFSVYILHTKQVFIWYRFVKNIFTSPESQESRKKIYCLKQAKSHVRASVILPRTPAYCVGRGKWLALRARQNASMHYFIYTLTTAKIYMLLKTVKSSFNVAHFVQCCDDCNSLYTPQSAIKCKASSLTIYLLANKLIFCVGLHTKSLHSLVTT